MHPSPSASVLSCVRGCSFAGTTAFECNTLGYSEIYSGTERDKIRGNTVHDGLEARKSPARIID